MRWLLRRRVRTRRANSRTWHERKQRAEPSARRAATTAPASPFAGRGRYAIYSRLPLDELEPVSLPDDDLPLLEPDVDDDPVLPDVPLAERPDVEPLEVPELPLPVLELPVPELPLPMLLPELPMLLLELPMLLPGLPMLLPLRPLQVSLAPSPRLTRRRFSTSLTPGMLSTISSIMYFE
jgi:hypothetical protein